MPTYYEPEGDYYEPSESEINDWNIHNDHQEGNEDYEDDAWCSWHECHPDRCREVRH